MSDKVARAIGCMSESLGVKLDALLSVTAANAPIDYTALFGQVITELQAVNANTDGLEQILTDIKTDTTAITTNTANTVTELQNVIVELQSIDENTDDVEQLLTDILTQLTNAERYAYVPMPERCANVDGTPQYVVPVAVYDAVNNTHITTEYKDGMGNAIVGVIAVADECDCDCKACGTDCAVSILMDAYDTDRGLVQAGDTTDFAVLLDGVNQASITHDYTLSSDGVNVSSYYTPITAAINAVPGWSISVDTDVAQADQGKVTWLVEYAGQGPSQLQIVKGTDTLTIDVDADCNITGTSDDGGTGIPFGSDPFTEVVDPVTGNFVTVGLQADALNTTGWQFTNTPVNPLNGASGNTYTELKAALVTAGYTVVTADADVPELEVNGPVIPPGLKIATPTSTVLVTWV